MTIAAGTAAGTTTFTGAVSGIGDATGAAITIASTGLARFMSTVGGASGIVSSAGGGSTRFDGNVTLTNGDTGSSFAGTTTLDGLSWSGFDGLTFTGAVTLSSGAVSLTSNDGAIQFASTVDGGQDLTLTAGAGNITATGAVGGTTALASVLVNSAADVTLSSTIQTTGNVTQSAGTGTTTFNGTSGGGIGGNLGVTTDAITFSTAGVTTTGTINLNAQNAVSVNASTGLNATASTITIAANQDGAGAQGFSQANGTTIQTTNAGATAISITVGGTGGAGLAALQTDGAGRTTVTAGGAISDTNAAAANITGGSAALSGVGGIGSGNALETAITNLAFSNTTSGNVELVNTGALTINSVGALTTSSSTGTGKIDVHANSPLTVSVAVSSGGDILLQAGNSASDDDDLTISAGVSSTGGGLIELIAGDDFSQTTGTISTSGRLEITADNEGAGGGDADRGEVSQSGGNISVGDLVVRSFDAVSLTSATNSVTNLAALVTNSGAGFSYTEATALDITTVDTVDGITTNDGNILVNATAGTITVSQEITTAGVATTGGSISLSGAVTVGATITTAGGDVTLNGSTAANSDLDINFDLTSTDSMSLTAPRDIFVGAKVETTGAGSTVTLTADFDLDVSGGVRIEAAGQVDGDSSVTILGSDLSASGGVTDAIDIDADGTNAQIVAGSGGVSLASGPVAPSASSIIIDGLVNVTGSGVILVNANRDVTFAATGDLTTAGGAITVNADVFAGTNGGVITQADGSVLTAGTNSTITLLADGNITLGAIDSGSGLSKVTTANGAILDADGGAGIDITAGTAALRAETGVGTDAIETTFGGAATTLTLAAETESGDISVSNTGSFTIGTVDGLVGVTILDTANNNSGNDDITLVAASPLTVNSAVTNNDGGDITLTATNDGGNDDHLTISANVTALGGSGFIDLNAGTDLIINSGSTISTVNGGEITGDSVRATAISAASSLTTVNGGITLLANAGGATAGNFTGLDIDNSTIQTTGTGKISLTGSGGLNGGVNPSQIGVFLRNGAAIHSTAPGATAGTIAITGTGGTGTGSNHGVSMSGSLTEVTSDSGKISINGTGGSSGGGLGVTVSQINRIESLGTGVNAASIEIVGLGQSGISAGVNLFGSPTKVRTIDGDISINGTASGGSSTGVAINRVTEVRSTGVGASAGTITIVGVSGGGVPNSVGVSVTGLMADPTVVATVDGDVSITGTANSTGNGEGVLIGDFGTKVSATGTADVLIQGNGGLGSSVGIRVRSKIATNSGTVTLTAADDIQFVNAGSPGAVESVSGAVTITADTAGGNNGGFILMSDGSFINAGSGTIDMDADGNITLGGVITTNATATAITIDTTSGGVVDGGDTDVDIIANSVGAIVTINAVTGVGSTDDIETSIAQLVLNNTTSGDVDIDESGAIIIREIDQDAATGKVTLTAAGTITIEDAQSGISSLAGNIVVDANGATADIANNHTITSTSGLITLTADNTITFDATSSISSTSGNVSMTADADADNDGAITMTDGSFVNSGTGTITAAAADDITLARFVTTNNTAAAVSITSGTGGLIDGGDTNTDNIEATGAAATVTITTATGIGHATPVGGVASHAIETEISRLDAGVTGTGSIDINELDAINLLDVDTNNGRITVDAGGTITATDVESVTDANANDIALSTTAGGIIVTLIDAGTANGDVILVAQTSITESTANTTTKITADGLLLSASGGSVGAETGAPGTAQHANLLDLAVNELEASVAGGGLFVVNTQALTLEDTDLAVAGNDGIDRDDDGAAASVTSTGGTVRVNTTAGSLTIEELVNAAGQLATFQAVGIFSDGDGNTSVSDVNAASVAFRSTGGVGTMADGLEINATSTTNGLAFLNATTGDVFIRDVTGGLVIDNVDALTSSQNTAADPFVISVIALSPLTVSHDVIANGAVTLTATDAVGTGDNLLVTTPTTIQSTASVITIRGGDNVTFEDKTKVIAADTITVEGDFGNADAGTGSTITFNGSISSPMLTTVLGNADPDFIRVFPTSPDVLDTDTTSKMELDGAGSADQYFVHTGGLNGGAVSQDVTIDDSGAVIDIDRATVYGSSAKDGTKALPVIVHNNVTNGVAQTGGFVTFQHGTGAAGDDETVDYTTTLERLEVRGDEVTGGSALPPDTFDEVDYFDVQPSQSARILIHSNDPQFGDVDRVPDGDVLDVDPFNNTFTIVGTTIFTDSGSPSPFLGVTFRNIESVPLDPIGTDTQKYDFDNFNDNTGTASPTYAGYTSVLNSTFYGVGGSKFGFVPLDPANPFESTALNDVDDGPISSSFSNLVRDGVISTVPQTFKTDIANGWYLVSVKVTNTPDFSVVDADANFTIISGKDITGHGEVNFVTQVKDGSLDLRFSGLEVWRVDGLEIRPGHILTEGSPEKNPLAADGATIDTFTGFEGTPGALITVSGGLDINGDDIPDVDLEVTSTDADADLAGVQVVVGGDGQWDYAIRRPALAGTAYVNFAEFDGAQTGATAIDYVGPMTRRFDFGRGDLTGAAALAAIQTPRNGFPVVVGVTEPGGYINVTPGDTNLNASGYGWAQAPKVSDYPSVVSGSTAALLRDQHQGDGGTQGINTFSTQVANGTYFITATVGHALGHVSGMLIRGEGNDLFGSIATQPGEFLTLTNAVPITVVDGVLDLQFESTTDELWSIAGLEIRAVSLVTGGVTILTHLGTATADGTTVDTITGSSAPNAILTVSSTLGTITSADISSIYGGTQIQASAAGVWSFTLQRPTVPGAPTISVVAADGSGSASDSTVITYQLNGATPTLFDFNIQSSPTTQSGFRGVITDNTYTAGLGYGWVGTAPSSFSHAAGASTIAALVRDGAVSSGSGTPAGVATHTFRADLAPGNYEVTVIYGSDSVASGDTITVNGAVAPSITGLSSAAGQHTQRTFIASTTSLGGRDTITVGFGSSDATPWTVNGIIFRKVSTVPVLSVVPQATPVTADGTSVDTFSVSGLSVGQVYTVTTTSGTVTTVDADPQMAGVQFVAGAATATFMIQRPATAGTATIAVEHITGNGRGATTQGYQIATSRRFDFDTASSPTAAGFTSVTPQSFFNTTTGYGWTDYIPNAYDRAAATGTTTTALYRDGVHAQDLTFKVAVDDLTAYNVRVYFGDEFVPTQGVITVEGAAAPVTTAFLNPQQFSSQVVSGGTDANHDGFITIRLQVNSVAPTQAFFVSGLDIAQTLIGLPTAAPLTASSIGSGGSSIAAGDLTAIVSAAITRYEELGLGGAALNRLKSVQFRVQDLGGATLGLGGTGVVVIDDDAAGHGWFVDATPADDSEFASGSNGAAAGKIDLLTAVMHELGHELGLDDIAGSSDLMGDVIGTGIRRTADLDAVFAANNFWGE